MFNTEHISQEQQKLIGKRQALHIFGWFLVVVATIMTFGVFGEAMKDFQADSWLGVGFVIFFWLPVVAFLFARKFKHLPYVVLGIFSIVNFLFIYHIFLKYFDNKHYEKLSPIYLSKP